MLQLSLRRTKTTQGIGWLLLLWEMSLFTNLMLRGRLAHSQAD